MRDVPTIVLEVALRSLEQQERELGELRVRANTVIAAAVLTASFLGAAAIREAGGLSELSIAALVAMVITGGLSLYISWTRELRFAFDARDTYAELYPAFDNVASAQLTVAYGARDRYRAYKEAIDDLETAFELSVIALGAETVLWTLALGLS